MVKKTVRESNFELLRILAIFLIICFHYMIKGDWCFEAGTLEWFIQREFLICGEIGVIVFILITGYFMASPNAERKWRKVFYLYATRVFYILLIRAFDFFVLGNPVTLSWDFFVRIFLPGLSGPYWFVTVYLTIYIMSPYINSMIFSLPEKKMKEFLAISLILWCVIPTAFRFVYGTSEMGFNYNKLIWLIVIYCIGAYIRIYEPGWAGSLQRSICFFAGVFVFMSLINLAVEFLPRKIDWLTLKESAFWEPNTVLMLIVSVSLFNTFRLIKIKKSLWINMVSKTSLGVYMLHDSYLAGVMWNYVKNKIRTGRLFFDIIAGAAAVFLVAGGIELCRQAVSGMIRTLILKCKNR